MGSSVQSTSYRKRVKDLRSLGEDEALVLAARSALRVLPMATARGASPDDMHLLQMFRAAIMHAPGLVLPSAHARDLARGAAMSVAGVADALARPGLAARQVCAAVNGLARSAALHEARIVTSKGVADAAADAIEAAIAAIPDAAGAHDADRGMRDPLAPARAVFDRPLWPDRPGMPDAPARAWQAMQVTLSGDAEVWRVWRDWYQGYLDGAPMDWELQAAIALIPDETWAEGPAAVAGAIAERKARHRTGAAIAEMEAEIRQAGASRHGIGGNNPPEPLEDDASALPPDLMVAWEPLQTLKAETRKPAAHRDTVHRAVAALRDVLQAGLRWAAGKADLAVETTIKWGIPAVGGGYFAMNPQTLEALVGAAEAWLALLR